MSNFDQHPSQVQVTNWEGVPVNPRVVHGVQVNSNTLGLIALTQTVFPLYLGKHTSSAELAQDVGDAK